MNTLEKFFYISVGLLSDVTKRLDKTLKNLVEQGKLSNIDAKKIMQDFKTSTEKYSKQVNEKINQFIENALENLQLAKKSDLDEIQKRIEDLENKLKQL